MKRRSSRGLAVVGAPEDEAEVLEVARDEGIEDRTAGDTRERSKPIAEKARNSCLDPARPPFAVQLECANHVGRDQLFLLHRKSGRQVLPHGGDVVWAAEIREQEHSSRAQHAHHLVDEALERRVRV